MSRGVAVEEPPFMAAARVRQGTKSSSTNAGRLQWNTILMSFYVCKETDRNEDRHDQKFYEDPAKAHYCSVKNCAILRNLAYLEATSSFTGKLLISAK